MLMSTTVEIAVSRLHFPVTSLGPGRRIGIWFQGCSIRCRGCISADTWARGRDQTTVGQIVAAIKPWIGNAEGFTVSGGEPFDQPQALAVLLAELRKASAADVLVFTGYPIERLHPMLAAMVGLIDALVADPYDEAAPQTLALRGSDNQRLMCLTPLGVERFAEYERPLTENDRAMDVMFDEDGQIWFAGIPRRNDFKNLERLLRQSGAQVATSQDRARGVAQE